MLYDSKNQLPNLDSKILEMLEMNGFSLEDNGTEFYKEVIKTVVLYLNVYQDEKEREQQKINLQEQLFNRWSIFYFLIATNINVENFPEFNKLNGYFKCEAFHNEIFKATKKSILSTRCKNIEHCYMNFIIYFSSFILNSIEKNEIDLLEISDPKTLNKRPNK